MRIRTTHLPQILLGLALLAALCWNLAYGAEVRWVQMDMNAAGTRAEIGLDTATEYKIMRLSNPERLVVDFPASRLGARFAPPPGMGVVRTIRHGQPVPGTVRIVFDLMEVASAREPEIKHGPDGVWLVIEWPGKGPATAPPPLALPSAPAQSPLAPPPAAEPDVVVWPLDERIVIPGQPGSAPEMDLLLRQDPNQPLPTIPPPLPTSPPSSPPTTDAATHPPAAPALDLIAQIAAATQTGAAEQIMQTAAAASPASLPAQTTAPTPAPPPRQMATAAKPEPATPALRPLVIAIDPGHGGRDPGAIGPGGTYEKHIVLAIARELARQIDATPGMRAQLIRNSDVYVELPDRARLAREAKADMFVSIHADAAHNHSAQGASVYTLSTTGASSQHARWLADRENSADLIGGVKVENNTLSSVLLDLAHSGHMKASQDAAAHVLTGLGGVGKAHKHKVEYANFSVLRNADMPAMLVETGFISNAAEEKRLKDPAHQRRVASAILKGIDSFFRNQPPPGTMFAANNPIRPVLDAGGGSP